jgi:hypothetical protein
MAGAGCRGHAVDTCSSTDVTHARAAIGARCRWKAARAFRVGAADTCGAATPSRPGGFRSTAGACGAIGLNCTGGRAMSGRSRQPSDRRNELIDVFWQRVKAAHPAHFPSGGVPIVETGALTQPVGDSRW